MRSSNSSHSFLIPTLFQPPTAAIRWVRKRFFFDPRSDKCSGVCYSGLWHHTLASLRPLIAAFSSMVSWAFSLPRMAHRYHYGCDSSLSSSSWCSALIPSSARSFYEFLASLYSVSRFSSPLRPSKDSPGSITPSLLGYGLSTSSGLWLAQSSTSYRNWSLYFVRWKTDGPLAILFSGRLSSFSPRSYYSPLARRYAMPSSTTLTGCSFSLCACFSVWWWSISIGIVSRCVVFYALLAHVGLIRGLLSAGGSRVLCRLKSVRMGGQGSAFGWTRFGIYRGCCEQLPWCTRQPRGGY